MKQKRPEFSKKSIEAKKKAQDLPVPVLGRKLDAESELHNQSECSGSCPVTWKPVNSSR